MSEIKKNEVPGIPAGLSAGNLQPAEGQASPGSNGRGAMYVCPECGMSYAKTMDGQNLCPFCFQKNKKGR